MSLAQNGKTTMLTSAPAPKPLQRKSIKQYVDDKSLMSALEREIRRMLRNKELKASDRIKVIEYGWRVTLIRKRGEILGTVEATDQIAAEAEAAAKFGLIDEQRKRLILQEIF
jgi:hypothetical protein